VITRDHHSPLSVVRCQLSVMPHRSWWRGGTDYGPRTHSFRFSLLELTACLAIVSLLMSAVFTFMATVQKRQQSNSVIAESNQSARAGWK